jgi:hypothetical protein
MPEGSIGHTIQCPFPGYRSIDHETLRLIIKLLLILGALFLLDVVTTQIILWMGGAELNPFMTGIVTNPLLHLDIKILLLLVIFPVSLIAEQRVRGSAAFFYCALILLYIVVVVNNLIFILPQVTL